MNAEIAAQAKLSIQRVDPATVDLSEAADWINLFNQAQDYPGARAIATRWEQSAAGRDKAEAQFALLSAEYRAKNFPALTRILSEAKPADNAQAIRFATLANGYVLPVLQQSGKEEALKLIATAEKLLPAEPLPEGREKEAAARAASQLKQSRKLIEENPGKEAVALEKSRREALATLLARVGGTNGAASQGRAEQDQKRSSLVGKEAPAFKPLKSLGSVKSLTDLKGKVVMLDFFAHWCGPCIASLPTVRSLSEEFKDKGLEVVGMTRFYGYYKTENRSKRDMPPQTELERMKDFIKEKNITWPVAFVEKSDMDAYACSAIPQVVLIDKTGRIRKIKVGYYPAETAEFRKEIEALLAE